MTGEEELKDQQAIPLSLTGQRQGGRHMKPKLHPQVVKPDMKPGWDPCCLA